MTEVVLAAFLARDRSAIHDRLVEWLRIPSISSNPTRADAVRASAQWCADRMAEVGLENVAILDTPGHPSVYGDWCHAGADASTVLVYGHHDVQPVEPLDQWVSPPFEPQVRHGELFARGAVDDKGQVLYHLEAVRGLLERDGALPVNLKVLVEGEEEIGSPHFEKLLRREAERLTCDVVVVSDTEMLSRDIPSMCVGMRGLVALEVRLTTSTIDLHSGSFGGAVPNAARHAATLIAALHTSEGRVAIPGFYDAVRPPSAAERSAVGALPFDVGEFMAISGVRILEGEEGYSTVERIGMRPTAEVTGLGAGHTGPGVKTIVPSGAVVKLAFRLVPDQDPVEIAELVEAWVRVRVPAGVDVEITRESDGVKPMLTPPEHPAVAATARAVERVWGTAPRFTREGGSGPEEALGRVLDAPVVFLGVGLPDDAIHAPNERIVLEQFDRGVLAAAEVYHELGAMPRPKEDQS